MSRRSKKPKAKLKKLRPSRDMNVPAMTARGGAGAHRDERAAANRSACREWSPEDDPLEWERDLDEDEAQSEAQDGENPNDSDPER